MRILFIIIVIAFCFGSFHKEESLPKYKKIHLKRFQYMPHQWKEVEQPKGIQFLS